MHDPLTLAWTIKIPLCFRRTNTLFRDHRKEWQFYTLANIWHKDPELRGHDDSCGWFVRSHHGSEAVLAKIEKRFEDGWDRVFKSESGHTYYCGYFQPNGTPNLSVTAVVLNLFFLAACEYFNRDGRTSWKKPRRWMQKHLFDIMLFAENPTDSLSDGITMKFGAGGFPSGNESKDSRHRKERIHSMASCIYGWIMREQRPWWKHPRWHIHHWRIQIPCFQSIKRAFFDRCAKCGKGFKWNESVISDWHRTRIWHDRCDSSSVPVETKAETEPVSK